MLSSSNRLLPEDRAVHDWYRSILSFPPHLVRHYLDAFEAGPGDLVLDPFAGTGTVLVECMKQGIPSLGMEANPLFHFASKVKTDWTADPDLLSEHAAGCAFEANRIIERLGFVLLEDPPDVGESVADFRTLDAAAQSLLLRGSISPVPLLKTQILLHVLNSKKHEHLRRFELTALARSLVSSIGNLQFRPEISVTKPKSDVDVTGIWLEATRQIASDLRVLRTASPVWSDVLLGDSRCDLGRLYPNLIDAVITSPPYPNEKDYTRASRLESVVLGFIGNKKQLREVKRSLVRSNTKGIYSDDDADAWARGFPLVLHLAEEIERRRRELGKDSGFERMYPRVVKLYFAGMHRHLVHLSTILRPGAMLAYVVGDQASYLRVMIRTGEILREVAESAGYEFVRIDLFRTRWASGTKQWLREEVVVLRWSGIG